MEHARQQQAPYSIRGSSGTPQEHAQHASRARPERRRSTPLSRPGANSSRRHVGSSRGRATNSCNIRSATCGTSHAALRRLRAGFRPTHAVADTPAATRAVDDRSCELIVASRKLSQELRVWGRATPREPYGETVCRVGRPYSESNGKQLQLSRDNALSAIEGSFTRVCDMNIARGGKVDAI